MQGGIRQLTLVKKGQYYLFRYAPGDESQMLEALMGKAQDPRCPLDWFDAAVLSHQMGHRMANEMQALLKAKLSREAGQTKAADAA